MQRLPVISGIEGSIDAKFGAREKQPPAHRIFTNSPGDAKVRNAGDDFLPGLAAIARAEEIGMIITAGKDRSVGGICIMPGSLDGVDSGTLWQTGRSDVGPASTIMRDVNQPGGAAHPN